MTNEQRKQFWKRLGEIQLYDFPELVQWAMQYNPKHFYRYRSVSEYTLSDLKNNYLGFSRAKYFDDPFDAFIRIDYQKFIEKMKAFDNINVEPRRRVAELFDVDQEKLFFVRGSTRLTKAYQTESFKAFVEKRKETIRNYLCMACLTERYDNENMWLKYADSHKGFCLEYDFSDPRYFINESCNPQEKCPISGKPIVPYPVYYAEEPFDATDIFINEVVESSAGILNTIGESDVARRLVVNATRTSPLSLYQISLVKDQCHMYDEEWRLIFPGRTEIDYPHVCLKPVSIILGLRMDTERENTVLEAAKSAGVGQFFKMAISEDNKLKRKQI